MSLITPGSLYLVALAQANNPHIGLMIPLDENKGSLIHIKVAQDVNSVAAWIFEARTEKITESMMLTTMLQIHDNSKGKITLEELKRIQAESAPAPGGDKYGMCMPWAIDFVNELAKRRLVTLQSAELLTQEFDQFARGNRAYANRKAHPNVKVSQYCE